MAYLAALMTNTRVDVFLGGKLAAMMHPGWDIIMYRSREQVARRQDADCRPVDLPTFEITPKLID